METNAATELLKLVSAWNEDTSNGVTRQRNTNGEKGYTEAFWQTQARAVSLLTEVEAFSVEIGDFDSDLEFFRRLREFVWAPHVDWDATSYVLNLDDLVLSNLRKLARMMRSSPHNVRLEDAEVVALRRAVQQCLDLLRVAPAGVKEHGEHIGYLLERCANILDGDAVDLIGLQSLSFMVVSDSLGTEVLWQWDKSAKFFQNVAVIARAFGPKVAVSAASSVTSDLVIKGAKVARALAASAIRGEIEPPK